MKGTGQRAGEPIPEKQEEMMNDLLTTEQVGEILGINDSRVRQLIAAGRLPATKYGGVWLVRAADLHAVRERRPGRPPKDGLAMSAPEDPVQTFGYLRLAMLEAETEDDMRALYDQLVQFYQRDAVRAHQTYLGEPQTPDEAALRAIDGELDSLPEDTRAAWIAGLDTIRG